MPAEIAVQLDSVSKRWGDTLAVDNISFTTDRALACGTSLYRTLCRVVALTKPSEGERTAAVEMVTRLPGNHRVTVGADRGYDSADFIDDLRCRNATPHVAQNTKNRRSAIDGRTTRHPGYTVRQRIRKRIEETIGWGKTVGPLRQVKVRGVAKIDHLCLLTYAAYNLVLMRNLVGAVP